MLKTLRRNKFKVSLFGLISISLIFFLFTNNFKKNYERSIVIEKKKLEIFHKFFTKDNFSTWFPDLERIEISSPPKVGDELIFYLKNFKVTYKIVELNENKTNLCQFQCL